MLEIKKASILDAEIIGQLGRTTFTQAFGHLFRDQNDLLEYLDRTFSVPKLKSSLNKAVNIFWIAYWNNLPVGYAKLKLFSPSEVIGLKNICQLQKIYVLRDFLSKKIGLELQNVLLTEANQKGFELIWLSVWEGNSRAIKFYEKTNYRNVGEHNFAIGKEQFKFQVMALDLAND